MCDLHVIDRVEIPHWQRAPASRYPSGRVRKPAFPSPLQQSSRHARATPLHYKELFGEANVVNMLVAAAGVALPSAESDSDARLIRSAEYGRVLLYLRALQPLANQKDK